jgi:hypothetical protein
VAGVVGGVAVMGHGLDTTVAGARMVWNGTHADSGTATVLQSAGMSPTAANLTDAGIGVAFTLGAGAATRAIPAAGVSLSTPSITVSHAAGAPSAAGVTNPIGFAIGHTRVGVTAGDGSATVWSHLTVPETGRVMMSGGTLVESGSATISTGTIIAPRAGTASLATVPVSASEARAAMTLITESAPMSATNAAESGIFTVAEAARPAVSAATHGSAGPYALFANDCASYGTSVLTRAGVNASGATPSTLFVSTALRSEAPVTTLLTSQLVSRPAVAISATSNAVYGIASTATPSSIPDPNNYSSYDDFRSDISGPYTEDYIMQQWADVHGWQSH